MNRMEQNLQHSLIPDGFEKHHHRVRNMERKRLALGRALTSEKYANKQLRDEISQMNTHLTSLQKKRRQTLLIGIKFRQLLDNVTTAKNMNELLEKEHNKKVKKEEEDHMKRREHYLTRRNSVAETRQVSRLVSAQKLQKIKNQKRRDTVSLFQEVERMRRNTRQDNIEKYQKIKSQHLRLKQKMKRIQQFKQARAQKNYLSKLFEMTQRQTIKSNTLRDLKNRQQELESTFMSPDKTNQSMFNTNRDPTKRIFTTDLVYQKD